MKIAAILSRRWQSGGEWLEKWYNTELCMEVMRRDGNPLARLFAPRGVEMLVLNTRWLYNKRDNDLWEKNKKNLSGKLPRILELTSESEKYIERVEAIVERIAGVKEINIRLLAEIKRGLTFLWYVFLADLGDYIGKVIDQKLKSRGLNQEEIEIIKQVFNKRRPQLAYQKEEEDLKQIAALYKNQYQNKSADFRHLTQKLQKLIKDHRDKYCWTTVNDIDLNPYTPDDYLKRVRELSVIEDNREKKPSTGNLFKRLSKEDKQFLTAVYRHIYLDNYAADLYAKLDFLMQKKIFQKCKISFRKQSWYSFSELERLIRNGQRLKTSDSKQRRNHRVMVQLNGELATFYNEAVFKKLSEKVGKPITKRVTMLTGQPACLGCVEGLAKIVKGAKDIDKVQKGDILVATTTRPDLMLAIRRCAAIVTDYGGITSHAAIISREFNIPCVVGTSIATQVLKDGDLVEVDATVGVVRILNKTNLRDR